jgi:uncharacterized beta-barrel protein YwiB (DUF1934 family)
MSGNRIRREQNLNVKIKIRGEQGEQDNAVEVVSVGKMYEEDGFVCLSYDEVVDEEETGVVQTVKNLLKINENQVEVIKKGPAKNHMVFVPGQTTFSYYSTPVGELEVSIFTETINKITRDDGFSLDMQYQLEMNQMFVSDSNINIEVEY